MTLAGSLIHLFLILLLLLLLCSDARDRDARQQGKLRHHAALYACSLPSVPACLLLGHPLPVGWRCCIPDLSLCASWFPAFIPSERTKVFWPIPTSASSAASVGDGESKESKGAPMPAWRLTCSCCLEAPPPLCAPLSCTPILKTVLFGTQVCPRSARTCCCSATRATPTPPTTCASSPTPCVEFVVLPLCCCTRCAWLVCSYCIADPHSALAVQRLACADSDRTCCTLLGLATLCALLL